MSRSTADDLEAAADLLESEGWVKGSYRKSGGFCAVGALLHVINPLPLTVSYADAETRAWLRVNHAIRAMGFETQGLATGWNDDQSSAEPVIELMKQSAKDLRNRAIPTE